MEKIKAIRDKVVNKTTHNVDVDTKGHVIHALYCAIWAALYEDDFVTAIRNVVLRGGDTDTNAAVVGPIGAPQGGAIMGAKVGIRKMEEDDIVKHNINLLKENNNCMNDVYTLIAR
jgi:ADP-ribosylglycohydrolase